MKSLNNLIMIILGLFIVQAQSEKAKPDMIVVLSRHGAREPLDRKIDKSWKHPSELMDLGIDQHYALGVLLNENYPHLLNDIAPSEIYLQSTESSRTQMSLAAELAGISRKQFLENTSNKAKPTDFSLPFDDEKLVEEVMNHLSRDLTRIPNRLMVLPKNNQKSPEGVLQVNPSNCIAVSKGQDKRLNDVTNLEMSFYVRSTIGDLRVLGYKIRNLLDLKEVGDTLANRFLAGKPPLKGIPYHGKIYNDTVFSFKWWNMYNLVGTKLERSLRVFPIHTHLIDWFNAKVEGNSTIKVALIGGHESTMFPLLSLYNISDHECYSENYKAQRAQEPLPFPDCEFPEYASQMIYELYNSTGTPYIRLLYNGKPRKFCKYSPGVECTLEQFIKEKEEVLGGLNQASWNHSCQEPQDHKETSTSKPKSKKISKPDQTVVEAGEEGFDFSQNKLAVFLIGLITLLGFLIGIFIVALLVGMLTFRKNPRTSQFTPIPFPESDISVASTPKLQIK